MPSINAFKSEAPLPKKYTKKAFNEKFKTLMAYDTKPEMDELEQGINNVQKLLRVMRTKNKMRNAGVPSALLFEEAEALEEKTTKNSKKKGTVTFATGT